METLRIASFLVLAALGFAGTLVVCCDEGMAGPAVVGLHLEAAPQPCSAPAPFAPAEP